MTPEVLPIPIWFIQGALLLALVALTLALYVIVRYFRQK